MALAHDRYLITGCSDNELRFFALRSSKDENDAFLFPPNNNSDEEEQQTPIHVQSLGSLVRRSKQRVSNLTVDQDSRVLVSHVRLLSSKDSVSFQVILQGVESFCEFFRISTLDEVRTRLRKRLAKARKRQEEKSEDREETVKIDWDISLIFTPLCEMRFDGKIRAMEMFMDTSLTCKVDLNGWRERRVKNGI